MRRLLVTSFALLAAGAAPAATALAAPARTPPALTVHADWFGSTHRLFVDTAWTPTRLETTVTVKVAVNGTPLRTLSVTHWVIGHKLFKLSVPTSIAAGSKARIDVRIHSVAGNSRRTVSLDLR